jgi:integrase/recombinase XerD
LEPTLEGALALARSATGPLSSYLAAFVTSLIDQRYAVVCVKAKAWRATRFDAWLHRQGVSLADVSEAHVEEYSHRDYQPRSDCRAKPQLHEVPALLQLLRYLRTQGLCAAAVTTKLPADLLLASFEAFLLRDRGLSAGSIRGYRTPLRNFLIDRFGIGPVDLGALRATDIIGFVQRQPRRPQPHALKHVVTGLRAFLRWGQLRGEIDSALICAVPAVASWATTPPLPRAISAENARKVIDSCNPDTAVGQRDRAVLLLLARLGLRGGEVLSLLLEDIDWDAGCLRIRGKNRRECLMPLPTEVGEAIALYLRHGRPTSADRHLFLRSRAPYRGLRHGSDGIGSVVRNALRRAGVDAPHKGSHQFRHALAVRLLREGASMPEIGDVLRHRSPLATAVYAKVDLAALRPLALPWPGSSS